MTQIDEILLLLKEGPVTPLHAWSEVGCYRLADQIYKLRKRGYRIETRLQKFTTTRGREVEFASYVLKETA